MPGEAGRDRGKRRICLMGAARALLPEGTALEKEELVVTRDAEAMELLALLVLGREFLPPEGVKEEDRAEGEVRRDWLAATMDPDGFAQEKGKRTARERVRYLLDKLHPRPDKKNPGNNRPASLPIRVHLGERERTTARVSWNGVWVDVLALREAARQLHSPDRQQEIIALGDRPLLEGMPYPWLEEPPFQKVRVELDTYFLTALSHQADSQIVQMEKASEAGQFAESAVCRSKALPLLDKAAERLRGYGERLRRPGYAALTPFEARFSELRRRAAYPLPEEAAPVALPAPSRLPQPATNFFGREREMQDIRGLLASGRLVTLTGMGGCGKTRMALQVAAGLEAEGGRDVRLVELASLLDPDFLPQTLARTLGVTERAGTTVTDALIAFLQQNRTLLLLDNCEHLLAGCANLAAALLRSCPTLSVLATSREPLNVAGEQLYRIPPLPFPAPAFLPADTPDPVAMLLRYDAARLFVDRALQFRRFKPGPENVGPIAAICAALDGIPLALELAAARVRALPLEQIAEMLSDRFGLLTGGRHEAPSRHKTLRAVIDWSYDLLSAPEQELMCRLSVFAGGWTLDAAEAVGAPEGSTGGSVLDLLTSLVDKSLVIAEIEDESGRYRMLETVRQYAQDRLRERGEWEETRRRHRGYFLAQAEEAASQLRGPGQKRWLDRLETEHDNIRTALAWRADAMGLRLACALQRFWWVRGYLGEGRKWLEREVEDPAGVSEEVRARALIGIGRLAQAQGDLAEARKLYEESLAMRVVQGAEQGVADALFSLGAVAEHLGDYEEASDKFQKSLRLSLDLGDDHGIASALGGLGTVAQNQDNYLVAIEKHQESLALRRKLGDILGIGNSLSHLGTLAYLQGRFEDAEALFEESLSLYQALGQKRGIAGLLGYLGELAQARGNSEDAIKLFDQSLALFQDIGDRYGIADILSQMAAVAYDEGAFERARELMQRCLDLLQTLGDKSGIAMLLSSLGSVARQQCRLAESRKLLRESLARFRQLHAKSCIANSLGEFALLAAAEGNPHRAARLWSAEEALSEQISYRRPPKEEARKEKSVQEVRETVGQETFAAAWAEGKTMTWEEAVAFALDEGPPA